MNNERIIKVWKDAQFRTSLAENELALAPANPAGTIELDESGLRAVSGAEVDNADFTLFIFCESVMPNCGPTVILGTCILWTYGCKCDTKK